MKIIAALPLPPGWMRRELPTSTKIEGTPVTTPGPEGEVVGILISEEAGEAVLQPIVRLGSTFALASNDNIVGPKDKSHRREASSAISSR